MAHVPHPRKNPTAARPYQIWARRLSLLLVTALVPASPLFAASGEVTVDVPAIAILNSLPASMAVSTVASVRIRDNSIPDDAVVVKAVFTSKKAEGGPPASFAPIISTHAELKGPAGRWNSKQWDDSGATAFTASDLEPDPMPVKGTWEVRFRGRNASRNLPGLKKHTRNTLTIHWEN